MSIKNTFKSIFNKLRRAAKSETASDNAVKSRTRAKRADAEISAEEVVREEIFPKDKRKPCAKANGRACASKRSEAGGKTCSRSNAKASGGASAKKRCSKNGTRPTNDNYQMVDPSNDSVDASES